MKTSSFQEKVLGELVFLHPGAFIRVTHDRLEFFYDLYPRHDEYITFNPGDSLLIISQADQEGENFFKVLCKFGVGYINGDFL